MKSKTVRLTFNKPAVAQFFVHEGEDKTDGLKVRIQDGAAHFLPVSGDNGDDVISLVQRSRGGAESDIEGTMVPELLNALKGKPGQPFYVMTRSKDGWLSMKPHGSKDAPPKFTAHMRVWSDEAKGEKAPKAAKTAPKPRQAQTEASASAPAPANAGDVGALTPMFDTLRGMRSLVEAHSSERRAGRPSRAVMDARNALAAFENFAFDFLPALAEQQRKVGEAHNILGGILSARAMQDPVIVPQEQPQKAKAAPKKATAKAEAPKAKAEAKPKRTTKKDEAVAQADADAAKDIASEATTQSTEPNTAEAAPQRRRGRPPGIKNGEGKGVKARKRRGEVTATGSRRRKPAEEQHASA